MNRFFDDLRPDGWYLLIGGGACLLLGLGLFFWLVLAAWSRRQEKRDAPNPNAIQDAPTRVYPKHEMEDASRLDAVRRESTHPYEQWRVWDTELDAELSDTERQMLRQGYVRLPRQKGPQ